MDCTSLVGGQGPSEPLARGSGRLPAAPRGRYSRSSTTVCAGGETKTLPLIFLPPGAAHSSAALGVRRHS